MTPHVHLWLSWPPRSNEDFVTCLPDLELGPFDKVDYEGRTFWPVVDDNCRVVRDALFAHVATPGEDDPVELVETERQLVSAGF